MGSMAFAKRTRDYSKVPIADGIVAIVGSIIITSSDVKKAKIELNQLSMQQTLYGQESVAKLSEEDILEILIEEKLVDIAINRIGIEVKDSEVESTITRILSSNQMSKEQLIGYIKQEGLDYEVYRENIRSRLLKERFRAQFIDPYIRVTDEQIKRELQKTYSMKNYYDLTFVILSPSEVEMWKTLPEKDRKSIIQTFQFDSSPTPFTGFLKDLAPQVSKKLKNKPTGYTTGVISLAGQSAVIRINSIGKRGMEDTTEYIEKFEEIRRKLYQSSYKRYMIQWVKQQKLNLRIERFELKG